MSLIKNINQDDESIKVQMENDIVEWMEENFVKNLNRQFSINEDLTVNTRGYVTLSDDTIKNLPKYIKFHKHEGSLNIVPSVGGIAVEIRKNHPPFTHFDKLPKIITMDLAIDLPLGDIDCFPKEVCGSVYLDLITESQYMEIIKLCKTSKICVCATFVG